MAETSFVTPILKGVAASAGISGMLAALGYVVHFSQEDFLGVPLSAGASGVFVLEGARFVADLCLFSFASLIPLILMAALMGLVLLVAAGARKWRVSQRLPAGLWASLFLFLVFAELACNDLPMVYVSGLLFKSTEELQVGGELHVQPQLPPFLDHAARLLRDSVVCSQVPSLDGCLLEERQDYKDLLHGWFMFNLFVTVLILIVGLRALTRWLQPQPQADEKPPAITATWAFLGTLLSLGLLLNLFGLPFAYARTIKQNVFPTAYITLVDTEANDEAGDTEKKAPQSSAPEGSDNLNEPSGTTEAPPLTNQETQSPEKGQIQDGGTTEPAAEVATAPQSPAPDTEAPPPANQEPQSTRAVQLQAGGETEPTAEATTEERQTLPDDQLWQILSYGEDRFVLYRKSEAEIWSIPKESVRIIRIRNQEDVLESYLVRKTQQQKPSKKEAKR